MIRLVVPALLLFVACGPEVPETEPADASIAEAPDAGSADAGDPCARTGVQRIVSLAMEPATVTVEKGAASRIAVWATFDSGCVRNVTGSVSYTVADPTVAEILEVPADEDSLLPGRAISGLKKGSTTVSAYTGSESNRITAPTPVAVTVTDESSGGLDTETRGVWVTRFSYHSDKATGTADIQRIIKSAADNNFNAVYFQVRGAGDAYYRSDIVPWWITTTGPNGKKQIGKDPGWDPLQVAIDAAHGRGLQLHAYINAMSGWSKANGDIPEVYPGAPAHVLRQHPEWSCKDAAGVEGDSEYFYIAAEPGYRQHFAQVVEEIITRYDVDGIHLDRIRTPGPRFCHTTAMDAAQAASGKTFENFQREQIDLVVKAAYDTIVAKKPGVVLSAAVWGIYKRLPGCSTSQGYFDYYQDSLGWAQKGFIDQLNPMIYWDLAPGSCTDWGALVDTFVAGAAGRQVVAGMHAREKDGKAHFDRIAARIAAGRKKKLPGHVVFASAYLDSDGTWDDYKAGPYQTPIEPTPITHR